MSEVFKAFNDMLGQRQLPTLAYRPQANGATERMIKTTMRAVKKYSKVEGHKDWDIIAERLAFSINTSFDTVRQETPFYLVHGWDAQNTLQSVLAPCVMRKPEKHGVGALKYSGITCTVYKWLETLSPTQKHIESKSTTKKSNTQTVSGWAVSYGCILTKSNRM